MKLFLAIIGLLSMLYSCQTVYFIDPQPKGGERLSEMPKELYGTWFGKTEGFQFNENGITNIDIEIDSLGNIFDTTYQTVSLSDTLRIYKAKELYVIHSKKNGNYWVIVILKPIKNGDVNIYFTSDPEIFASYKGLKLEEANFYIDGKEKSVKTLNPDFENSKEFRSAVFSGQMTIKTLRKGINKITPTIFKKDASIFVPADTIQELIIENE